MSNLSKKDLFIYRKFLNNIDKELYEDIDDNYLKLIKRFIEKYYESDENNLLNLEDYIQEAFILLLSQNKNLTNGKLMQKLKKMYYNLKQDSCFTEPISLTEQYEEIPEDKIDFKMFISKINKKLTKEEKMVLKYILNGESARSISNIMEIGVGKADNLRLKILRKIRHSTEFKKLYYDRENYIYSAYERFLIKCFKRSHNGLFLYDIISSYYKSSNPHPYAAYRLYELLCSIEEYCDKEEYEMYKSMIEEDKIKTKILKDIPTDRKF